MLACRQGEISFPRPRPPFLSSLIGGEEEGLGLGFSGMLSTHSALAFDVTEGSETVTFLIGVSSSP